MNKSISIIVGILIIFIGGYFYYNNSYVLLKPVLFEPYPEPRVVPYTDEMIKNFPDVLTNYDVPYKMNDSGHFLIQVKYMNDRDLVLTMTNCTIDTSRMRKIREQNAIFKASHK
jgi:hypothetical protein